jgi:hypothetical protein
MKDKETSDFYSRLLLPREPHMRSASHLIFWMTFIGYHMIFFFPILPERIYSPETRLAYWLYYARFIPIYYGALFVIRLGGQPFQKWFSPMIILFACILVTHLVTKPLYHFYDRYMGLENLPGNFQLIGKYYLRGWIPVAARDWYVFVYDLMDMQLLALPIGLKWIRRGATADLRRAALEKEQVEKELKELRAQLAPHFILNVLNAASVEVGTFSRKASEYLTYAADMIRFVLYDTRFEFVELKRELDFISRYLKLEAMRTSQRSRIDCQFTGDTKTARHVPTLMLTTLIENALKHGVHSTHEPSYVKIECHIEQDKLTFQVFNSKPASRYPGSEKTGHGGLGLATLRRRLEGYFPDKYHLRVTDRPESFLVYLQIPLAP